MQITCGVCHARQPLEACLDHEAASQVAGMLAGMAPDQAALMMAYVGFFRPAKQQLGWGRALRLMREVQALASDQAVLMLGLDEATRSLDEKRTAPGWRPLGNHNYLKRCLESAQGRTTAGVALVPTDEASASPAASQARARAPVGKQAQALMDLEAMKR